MQTWCSTAWLTLQRFHSISSPILHTSLRRKVANPKPILWAPYPTAAVTRSMATNSNSIVHGDLNNTEVLRQTVALPPDPAYFQKSLAIPVDEDDKSVRTDLRPFLLPDEVAGNDWVSKLELSTALKMAEDDIQRTGGDRLKVMVLYGSLRSRWVNSHLNIRIVSAADISGHTLACWHLNVHAYCTALVVMFVSSIRMACLLKTTFSTTMSKSKNCGS